MKPSNDILIFKRVNRVVLFLKSTELKITHFTFYQLENTQESSFEASYIVIQNV